MDIFLCHQLKTRTEQLEANNADGRVRFLLYFPGPAIPMPHAKS
jgi:hypothetical protein